MKLCPYIVIIATIAFLTSCSGSSQNTGDIQQRGTTQQDTSAPKDEFAAALDEMTKQEYPDNPNWGYTANEYGHLKYDKVKLKRNDGLNFDLTLTPQNDSAFPITLNNIDLSVYTPKAPDHIKGNDYLTYIGLVNQEWNRQQIRYPRKHFQVNSNSTLADSITRIDVARNCLNAGLWEVIAYKREGSQEKPVYHGWFDFPTPLYSEMFEKANDIPYKKYRKPLEKWVEPENKPVDLAHLRKVKKEWDISFTSLNHKFYPLVGSRKKKYKNIVYPKKPKTIDAMLTDSAKFATFAKPGYYDTGDPRHTQLGKLAEPVDVTLRKTAPKPVEQARYEIDITFRHNNGEDSTRLVIGGLAMEDFPRLSVNNHDNGFKMPMGIANHSFYETYAEARKNRVKTNPYYGLLLNEDKEWLDSHKVGIDGPLIHWDKKDKNVLHFYILSFERHAYVGHFELTIPKEAVQESDIVS